MCDGPVESIDAFDVDADDEVGSGAAVVHLRRSRVPRAQSLMEHVEQHGRVGDLGHVRSLHPHDPLLVLLDFQFHLPWIPLIPFHLILFRFYNAGITPPPRSFKDPGVDPVRGRWLPQGGFLE